MNNKIKIIVILALFTFFLGATRCTYSKKSHNNSEEFDTSGTPAHILSDYELVWHDEFEGTSVDTSKWNFRAEGSTRHYGIVSPKTISMNGKGQALIKVMKNENYLVGQLGTEGIFETTYGYFECRAKMNRSIGPHVAFWLQSPDVHKTGNIPDVNGTEIDVFEYHRKTPGVVHHNLHWNGYGESHQQHGVQIPYSKVDEGFHTFGLEWTKNEYVFYVDGEETWRTDQAISHRDEYLILSTELTGWGGEPEKGEFPDAVVFDYVRVFKKR